MQSDLLRFSWTDDIDCNIVDLVTNVGDATNSADLEDRFWVLYFDGSKTQEGPGVGCVLVDPENNKYFLSCRLEFECTNNATKYEALVQGLKKSIGSEIKILNVFGDSYIVVRKVRNTIHFLCPHIKGYLSEVWNLIMHFNAFNINAIPRLQNVGHLGRPGFTIMNQQHP